VLAAPFLASSFFIPSLLAELRGCYSIWRPFHCSDAGVLWGRIVLRNCIADEAKNRAVSSGFSGATEPDFALFVGSRAVAVEGTEGVQERGSRHAISTPIFCC
jgi:hypothetical protein